MATSELTREQLLICEETGCDPADFVRLRAIRDGAPQEETASAPRFEIFEFLNGMSDEGIATIAIARMKIAAGR